MNRLGKAFIAASTLAAASACFSDPTSDLRNGPARVSLSTRYVVQNAGDVDQIDIQVVDDQGNPLPFAEPTFTSLDPTVATMAPLPDTILRVTPGNTLFKSELTGLSAGSTQIVVTAGGVSDTVTVLVFPVAFTGTIAPATSNIGDTVTITAPAGITFDTSRVTLTVGGSIPIITSKSATQIKFIAPNGAAMTVVIGGGVLLGANALPNLTASTTITVNEPASGEPNNNMLQGTTVTPTATFQTRWGSLTSGTDANDFIRIVLAAPGTIEAFLDFSGTGAGTAGNPDIDVYTVRDVDGDGVVDLADLCNEFGGSFTQADCTGATGAQPEHEITQVLPAGTYFLNVELFLDGGRTTPLVYKLRYRVF